MIGTGALREIHTSIRAGLEPGEARIGVIGVSGLGKTCLAWALPKLLAGSFRVALLPDSGVSWSEADRHLATSWDLGASDASGPNPSAQDRKLRLVLVIDRAERATEEFLEGLTSGIR